VSGIADPPPFLDNETRYILTALLAFFPLLTAGGNALIVVAVFTHKRLQTITNAFVVSLAIADFMVALLVMPIGIYQQYNNKQWELGATFCKLTTSLDVMFTTTSIMHLSCLAIDRYLPIVLAAFVSRLSFPFLCLCKCASRLWICCACFLAVRNILTLLIIRKIAGM
jgi:hypothetical protein